MHAESAAAAYRRTSASTAAPAAIEADLLRRFAAEMRAAARSRDKDFPRFAKALSQNLRLWTVFAAEALDDRNQLPIETRAAIVSLARFVRTHTQTILNGDANADASALAEVNDNLASGLAPSTARVAS
jgi:flagellar protein FlaF